MTLRPLMKELVCHLAQWIWESGSGIENKLYADSIPCPPLKTKVKQEAAAARTDSK